MIITVDIEDQISPFLQYMAKTTPDFMRKAAKSLGWYVQSQVKKGVRSGHPGGQQFAERMPWKARKLLNANARSGWYGRMINAIGYEYKGGIVSIGWTSATSARYGEIQETGTKRDITPAMRRFWGSKLIPLKGTTSTLNLPARPFFAPVFAQLEPTLVGYVEDKLKQYIRGGTDFAAQNPKRRKYRVQR